MNTWSDLLAADLAALVAWAADEPWARDMAACQQDAAWHAEGDVWTHTRLVCDVLPSLPGWEDLPQVDRTKLALTALFHDSGKPATSGVDPETGRIRSPKHALVGERLARSVLREFGCPLETREEIAALVRYHSRPQFLLEAAEPELEIRRLSWLVDTKLLYLFALADTRGRDSRETSRPEENLHLWRMAAEENGCYGSPYPFENDHARFLFLRGELTNAFYVPREDYRCTVTMLAGVPGSGKDTWIRLHRGEVPVVALDELREELDIDPTEDQGEVVQLARARCREHLRAGADFVFNASNLLHVTRERWIRLFCDYGARIDLVYIEPPLATIRAQNRRRGEPVPERVIERLYHKAEIPTWRECHGRQLVPRAGVGAEESPEPVA